MTVVADSTLQEMKTSELNGKKNHVDICTNMDWLTCWEQKDATLFGGNEN